MKNYLEQCVNKYHLKELILFAIPLIIGQVGQMLFSIGDTFVAGKFSTIALSSIGVGSAIISPAIMFGVASCFSISAVASRLSGEGHSIKESDVFTTGLSMSLIFGLLITSFLFFGAPLIKFIGLNDEISFNVQSYVKVVSFSVIPALLYQAIKEFLQAMGDTFFANLLIIIFNIFNIILNYIFMFGYGPIPSFGIIGAAYATIITRAFMFIALFIYTEKKYHLPISYSLERKKELLKLGLPVGMGSLVEVLMFASVTVLVGKMATHISASHNIALNVAGLTFMVPFAINGTAGVKVAYAYGKKDIELIKNYSIGCIILAEAFMLMTATFYTIFPSSIAYIFTTDTAVISYVTGLFFYVALFQIPDGLQVVMWGILRGIGESRVPMLLSFMGYWLIAIPIGSYLAFNGGMQAKGLWAGLAIGLSIVSVLLVITFRTRLKKLTFPV